MTTLVKVLLTPALIALATAVERRWGPAVGGTVAGLPLTSAPVSIFLALEQGPRFAAMAAVGTLLGLISQGALCLVYSRLAQRTRWSTSALGGVAAFVVTTLVMERAGLPVWPAFALVSGLLVLTAVAIPVTATASVPTRPPRWELPVRMFTATVIVLVLTTAAALLGPTWTGLLSPFPVFALVLGSFAHRLYGPGAAARLLRGVVLGSLAHATMFALVASLLVAHDLVWTYFWGALGALAVNALAVAVVRTRGSRSSYRNDAA
jgi:hypothetical protein